MTLTKIKLPIRTKGGELLRPKSMKDCRFPRTVYRVAWDKGLQRWLVTVGWQVIEAYPVRAEAVNDTKIVARLNWARHGIPAQVWVAKKTTGRFSKAEATYGLDPKSSEG